MMAAIAASENNQVFLVEKNNKLGKKLFITGKGRCNVTNGKDISEFFEYIITNPYFLSRKHQQTNALYSVRKPYLLLNSIVFVSPN